MLRFLLWWQRYLAVFFHGYFLCIGHWLFFPNCRVHCTPVWEISQFSETGWFVVQESNWPILLAGLGYYKTFSTQFMPIYGAGKIKDICVNNQSRCRCFPHVIRVFAIQGGVLCCDSVKVLLLRNMCSKEMTSSMLISDLYWMKLHNFLKEKLQIEMLPNMIKLE